MDKLIFNENDQPYMMYDKLTAHISKLKLQKKNKILLLFNKIFNKDNTTLRNFKKIKMDYFTNNKNLKTIVKLLEDEETNLKIKLDKIKEYMTCKSKISTTKNPNKLKSSNLSESSESVSSTYSESDESGSESESNSDDNVNLKKEIDINKEIFFVLSYLLKTVDFKFQKFTESNKSYYKIVML